MYLYSLYKDYYSSCIYIVSLKILFYMYLYSLYKNYYCTSIYIVSTKIIILHVFL